VLFVVVNSELRERIRKTEGDTVRLELELDSTPVAIAIPQVLQRALARDTEAKTNFDRFTPSQRLAYVRWITEAKQVTTRDRRLATTIQKLHRGEKLN